MSHPIARAPPASCLYRDDEPGDSAADSEERAMRSSIDAEAAVESGFSILELS